MTSTIGRILAATSILAAVTVAGPARAEDSQSLFGTDRTASVTYGPYVRLSLGATKPRPAGGYWQPPGYPSDPEVGFDLSGDTVGMAEVAIGKDWQNGWRVDMSFLTTGSSAVGGDCSWVSNGDSCDLHVDSVSASVMTRAAMFNIFYAPFEARGSHSTFQPFVVASIGAASNEVGAWTRYNPNITDRPTRSFEGNTSVSPAWSVGIGAAQQITKPGKWPAIVEFTLRYYDFGEASGGATPLPGEGSSQPAQPLSFDNRQTVATLSLRVPLQRY